MCHVKHFQTQEGTKMSKSLDIAPDALPSDAKFCVGCRRGEACLQRKDMWISKCLFVLTMGWADDPTVAERIEGRVLKLCDGEENLD
jgi:hypothetical protein